MPILGALVTRPGSVIPSNRDNEKWPLSGMGVGQWVESPPPHAP